jgi:hypothetical protein
MADQKTKQTEDFEIAAGKSRDCLAGEELAALLDGRCDEAEVVRIKEHFNGCEECYNQWLTLVSLKMGAMKTTKIYPVRSRLFTYIGLALVLAVSVMVFLNIADIDLIPVMDQSEEVPQNLSGDGDRGDLYALWVEQVVESCRSGEVEGAGWQRLGRDAKELLEAGGANFTQESKDKLTAVIPLLNRLFETPSGGQCSLILTILAQR